ncbi:hypothetical protein OF897_13990 [Chryseobacterium formosus]|uniref:Uncharacterized protein n=1 Tax=Chryseobacterium formosus TaxID=1537363 RepID=A0ABT3XTV6_9FLAO|nr:hypothetical protein [Chryseobacterium formosus]MCX8525026.1 hypothetical protein [Chryseobacterium formosus]
MSIFKFLYSKNNIKRKILDIKDEMRKEVSSFTSEKVRVDYFGAYDINPKNLVFWICIESDKEKNKLKNDTLLMNMLKNLLIKYNYPRSAIELIFIDFQSQETIDREYAGNWYYFYK